MGISSPYLTRITGSSCVDARAGATADVPAVGSPPERLSVDLATPRGLFTDCLTSLGLPGEEAATTFVPLVIEPYEPMISTTIPEALVAAAAEPPPSPLTPPTSASQQPAVSPTAPAAAAAAAAAAAGGVMMPRPPPGSAGPRVGSCRRSLVRQASQVSTVVAAAAAAAAVAAPAAAPGSGGGATVAPAAALPAAPRTPLPGPVDTADLPPSPAVLLADVPVVVFDPSTVPVMGASGGGGGSGNDTGRPTSAFLDPSKPAVRRLLPPLLRASQALQDSATDLSPTGSAEDGSPGLPAGFRNGSFTAGGNTSPGRTAATVGGGGGGGSRGVAAEGWVELPEGVPVAAAEPTQAAATASLLYVDAYDTASPRGGRRSLPPMEALRSSTTTTADIGDVDLPSVTSTEFTLTPLETHGSYIASPRHSAEMSSARRAARELRGWGMGASDAGDSAAASGSVSISGGDGDVGCATTASAAAAAAARSKAVVQRTVSFHSASSGCGSNGINGFISVGGAAGSSSYGGGGGGGGSQPAADVPRLRARSGVMPEYTLLRLSSGDYAVATAAVNAGVPSPKEALGRPGSRPNSGFHGSRTAMLPMVPAAAAAAAAGGSTAALPPIVDRAGPGGAGGGGGGGPGPVQDRR